MQSFTTSRCRRAQLEHDDASWLTECGVRTDAVDWSAANATDIASLKVSVDVLNDLNEVLRVRRAAAMTLLGTVASSSVITIVCLLLGGTAVAALVAVLVHQLTRATVLWHKQRQARDDVNAYVAQTNAYVDELKERYPCRLTNH